MTTPRSALRQVAPRLAEITDEVVFGDIWERPELSKRDRSLITIASLISLYRIGQLPGHIQRGLDNGLSKEEIGEIITHMAVYAGWPCAAQASAIALEIFEKN